jgi:low molecular weight phosphotyrosine protein phosphatase
VLSSQAGITDYRHKARKIRVPQDFLDFDYILAMDEDNLIDLRDMAKRARKKGLLGDDGQRMGRVCLYGEFGGKANDEEVGDPYYGGRDGFEVAFEQVQRFGKGLLTYIEESVRENGT